MLGFFMVTLFIGVLLVYCSNKHQRLLKSPLKSDVKLIGYGVLLLALVISTMLFDGGAVFFMWFVGIMLLFITLPFVALFLGHSDAKK